MGTLIIVGCIVWLGVGSRGMKIIRIKWVDKLMCSLHRDLSSWHLVCQVFFRDTHWWWYLMLIYDKYFIEGSYRTQSQTNNVSKWEDNILKDIKSFTRPCTNWTTNEQETVRTSKAGKYSIIIIIITIIIKVRKMDSYMNDVFHLTNIFIL